MQIEGVSIHRSVIIVVPIQIEAVADTNIATKASNTFSHSRVTNLTKIKYPMPNPILNGRRVDTTRIGAGPLRKGKLRDFTNSVRPICSAKPSASAKSMIKAMVR